MPRVKAFLDCLGLALCDKARKPLMGVGRFGDCLLDVAKATLDNSAKELSADQLKVALADLTTIDPDDFQTRLTKLVDGLARINSIPFRQELIDYLTPMPGLVRRFLARPSDPDGVTPPDGLQIYKPEDLLLFLPPHPPKLRPGQEPKGLDLWKLSELLGFGETSETWLAYDPTDEGVKPVALKFAIEDEAVDAVKEQQQLFVQVFTLAEESGVVPLQSVFLETNPPALEFAYLTGYDLASLIWDWKWKYDTAKPEAALKLVRRIADIVGKAHAKGVVHRNLKPSNIRLHPTDGGKFTIWVCDFGWSQIASARSLKMGRTTPRAEQVRLSWRGAYSPLYASPQQTRKDDADPRDDVYALGVIWYQLLKRDPHAAAPVGHEWAEEFRMAGVTDAQARLLSACLSTRPDKRPANAKELSDMLGNVPSAAVSASDGSKLISIKKSGEHVMLYGADSGGPQSGGLQSGGSRSMAKLGMPALLQVAAAGAQSTGYGGMPRLLNNSIGMTFALIAPGQFLMGSPEGESGRRDHENPQHEVHITKPFYFGVLAVTQGQYEKVAGKNPSAFNRNHHGGPDHPVETLSWDDAAKFCERLSQMPDEQINGRFYRLPSEAEWEYACRAGTATPFAFGDKITPKEVHYAAVGAFGKSGGQARTVAVGTLPANAFGLHDMHGNVQEWVNDWYDEYYYFDTPTDDPPGPAHGTMRVVRGGCYAMFGNDCRSAARRSHSPSSPSNTVGFRIVLEIGR